MTRMMSLAGTTLESTVSSLAAAPKFPFLLTLTPTPINKLDERHHLSNLVASARQ